MIVPEWLNRAAPSLAVIGMLAGAMIGGAWMMGSLTIRVDRVVADQAEDRRTVREFIDSARGELATIGRDLSYLRGVEATKTGAKK